MPDHHIPRILHLTLDSHKGPVNVARYAKGSAKYIVTGGQDRKIKLWNRESGMEIKTYAGHGYEVLCVDVAHDNTKFASSGGDRTVFVWDVTTGETIKRFTGHLGRINAVAFNNDSSVLASGSYDSTVRLWDIRAQSKQAIQVLEDARDSIMSIYVGTTEIITGSVDGSVRSYDLRKGKLSSDYIGAPITSIAPADDYKSLLVVSLDSTIRLMDRTNGTMLNTYKGHVNKQYSCRACFGFGEAAIICGDEDGRVWAWDILDAKPIGTSPPNQVHTRIITWTEYHPTEKGNMVTASADGTVKLWRSS